MLFLTPDMPDDKLQLVEESIGYSDILNCVGCVSYKLHKARTVYT